MVLKARQMTTRMTGLQEARGRYTCILSDVWGVLHNGVSVYPEAASALAKFRAVGGHVVMITNSPRPREGVLAQFGDLGVDPDAYDDVVTSGDVTRDLISQVTGKIYHLGPDRDKPLFAGLDVELADAGEASAIVCTGLFNDEVETPEDYRADLAAMVDRKLPLICANPDIVVERGNRLIWCAGALARLYAELGGETRLAGKPHSPIYDLASRKLAALAGGEVSKSKILAIGDGMPTDVAGAQAFGADLLYISAGIHAGEYGGANNPDEKQLLAFLAAQNANPALWMPKLLW